jgi:hypothetical protein
MQKNSRSPSPRAEVLAARAVNTGKPRHAAPAKGAAGPWYEVPESINRWKKEANMFQVLDHAAVVYSGELSQTTQYIIEHYGKKLDEAIRSGIKIAYTDLSPASESPRKELNIILEHAS